MPGIDFRRLRREITMEQVLELLNFECVQRRGDQWYGRCPLHASTKRRPREFSVNVERGCYYCHKCQHKGDQFTLWADATDQPLYPATIELCRQLGHEVPWLHRW